MPAWKWSLGAHYETAIGNHDSLTQRFDVAYQSTSYSGASNTAYERIRHYVLANARLV